MPVQSSCNPRPDAWLSSADLQWGRLQVSPLPDRSPSLPWPATVVSVPPSPTLPSKHLYELSRQALQNATLIRLPNTLGLGLQQLVLLDPGLELVVYSEVWLSAMPATHPWRDSCSPLLFWDLPCQRLWDWHASWWPFCCSLLFNKDYSKFRSSLRQLLFVVSGKLERMKTTFQKLFVEYICGYIDNKVDRIESWLFH